VNQLEPLRQSLLSAASTRAAATIAQARADATATRAAAKAAAAKIIAAARAEGRRATEARAQAQLVEAERAARALVLTAERGVEDDARTRALAAAMIFRHQPEYTKLLDTLEASARRRLGPTTEIERDPPDAGGLRARHGRRSIDLTLASLVDQALTGSFDEVAEPAAIGPRASELAK
jgi:regulator of protease activity HflC (stomatin/prohibitin superfamily)